MTNESSARLRWSCWLLLWLQGLLGLVALLGGAYLAWDLVPYLRWGSGVFVWIAVWAIVGGSLAFAGLCVGLWTRLRRGVWLGRALATAVAGQSLLALPGLWYAWHIAAATLSDDGWPRWATPGGSGAAFTAVVSTWSAGVLSVAGLIAIVLMRRRLSLFPARPPSDRRYPVWPLLGFAALAPLAFTVAILGWGDLPTGDIATADDQVAGDSIADWLEDLTMPGSRDAAVAELEAVGREAQPVFAALAVVGPRAGSARRRAVVWALMQATDVEVAGSAGSLWSLMGADAAIVAAPRLDGRSCWRATALLGLDEIDARGASAVQAALAAVPKSRLEGAVALAAGVLADNGAVAVTLILEQSESHPKQQGWARLLAMALPRTSQRDELVTALRSMAASDDMQLRWVASRELARLGEAGATALAKLLHLADDDPIAYLTCLQNMKQVPDWLRRRLPPLIAQKERERDAHPTGNRRQQWQWNYVDHRVTGLRLLRLRLNPEDDDLHTWIDYRLRFGNDDLELERICNTLAHLGPQASRHTAALIARSQAPWKVFRKPELRPLIAIGSPTALDAVRAAMRTATMPMQRQTCIAAWFDIDPVGAIAELRPDLASPDVDTRRIALHGMRTFGAELDSGLSVLASLNHNAPGLRQAAARWCREAPSLPPEVARTLKRLRTDSERLVRSAASAALIAHDIEVLRNCELLIREAERAGSTWDGSAIVRDCLEAGEPMRVYWPQLRRLMRSGVGLGLADDGRCVLKFLSPEALPPDSTTFGRWRINY